MGKRNNYFAGLLPCCVTQAIHVSAGDHILPLKAGRWPMVQREVPQTLWPLTEQDVAG